MSIFFFDFFNEFFCFFWKFIVVSDIEGFFVVFVEYCEGKYCCVVYFCGVVGEFEVKLVYFFFLFVIVLYLMSLSFLVFF